jgi:DNA anti-recombination protein RmuC
MEHLANVGKGLTNTLNHYNKTVGSLEAGFLPQGRKINQMAQGFIKKGLPEILPVELGARDIVAIPPAPTHGLESPDNTAD